MQGHRWKLFCLWCRFIGWYVLFSVIPAAGGTLLWLGKNKPVGSAPLLVGLFLLSTLISWGGSLWLGPYINVSTAKFYDDLAGETWVVDKT